ncbi:hypothetical protein B0T16DRAFT_420649 [Cercophora newfieldiana]|uniref:Uncharacterized protein n=1 Tax=Cercophora newfieldiana TaxID=92897 RepID=A0AA40CKJ5_9PEZI|nr:hypothetical protein B0T16DRAFT_420649 [Cercophora newfieldiana]
MITLFLRFGAMPPIPITPSGRPLPERESFPIIFYPTPRKQEQAPAIINGSHPTLNFAPALQTAYTELLQTKSKQDAKHRERKERRTEKRRQKRQEKRKVDQKANSQNEEDTPPRVGTAANHYYYYYPTYLPQYGGRYPVYPASIGRWNSSPYAPGYGMQPYGGQAGSNPNSSPCGPNCPVCVPETRGSADSSENSDESDRPQSPPPRLRSALKGQGVPRHSSAAEVGKKVTFMD